LNNRHAGAHSFDIGMRRRTVEFGCLSEIELGHDGDIGAVEDDRVFEGLVLTFRDRKQNQPEILAQIVWNGAQNKLLDTVILTETGSRESEGGSGLACPAIFNVALV
jgi:hypothetical protein